MRLFLIIMFLSCLALSSYAAELIFTKEDIRKLEAKAKQGRKEAQGILDRYRKREQGKPDGNLADEIDDNDNNSNEREEVSVKSEPPPEEQQEAAPLPPPPQPAAVDTVAPPSSSPPPPQPQPQPKTPLAVPPQKPFAPKVVTCDGKTKCDQMVTCGEANFYLKACGVTGLVEDESGIPCRKLCKK